MHLEVVILSEVSQIEKDKYHMILVAFMWHLKKTKSGTDELIYKSNGHRYRMLIFKNIIFQSCKLLFKLSVSSLYA